MAAVRHITRMEILQMEECKCRSCNFKEDGDIQQ